MMVAPRSLLAKVGQFRSQLAADRAARREVGELRVPPAAAFGALGAGTVLAPPIRVPHPEWVHIGDGVVILEHTWLALEQLPGRPPPELRIGDGCRINRFVKIECVESVRLGEGVLIADQVHIGDVDLLPAHGAARAAEAQPAPVVIGDRAFVGAGSVIKQGVTIGSGAYVSAASVVTRDVPPNALVIGSPARVVRTWDEPQG